LNQDNSESGSRLRLSAQAARFVAPDAPPSLQLSAARGAVPFPVGELLQILFLLIARRSNPQVVSEALKSLRAMPSEVLAPVLRNPHLHPRLFDLVAKVRLSDESVIEALLSNRSLQDDTLIHIAEKGSAGLVERLAANDERLMANPAIAEAICRNPLSSRTLKLRFGLREQPEAPDEDSQGDGTFDEDMPDDDEAAGELEEDSLSKQQLISVMSVPEKIKMAMTGDKEWRSLLLRDANKLVCTAALKNPRITEGEVAMVAKNKSAADELIRIICLNRDWVKNQEIKKALVEHPKTPAPMAIRWMNFLTEKELKDLAKSRNVPQVISTNARRMLMTKNSRN